MKTRIAVLTCCLLFSVSAMIVTTDAATVFGSSSIVGVDQTQRTITFRTKEGQTWTLPVADPKLLDGSPIAQGDQVTIEINLDDKIVKVLKLGEASPAAPRTETEDR